jgi:hypothetical protein
MGVVDWRIQQGKELLMKRIRYVSEFTSELSADELDELARISGENNRRDSLTGVLVASGRAFFQLLKGPDGAVDASFERIRQDPRHTCVHVLGIEQGDLDRLCPDWAMNKLDLTRETEARFEPVRALLGIIARQRNIIEDLTGVLERVMWHERHRRTARRLSGCPQDGADGAGAA